MNHAPASGGVQRSARNRRRVCQSMAILFGLGVLCHYLGGYVMQMRSFARYLFVLAVAGTVCLGSGAPARAADATSKRAPDIGSFIEPIKEGRDAVSIQGYSGTFSSRPQSGYVFAEDTDDYAVFLNRGQTIAPTLSWGASWIDLDLRLYDPDDYCVASSTDWGTTSESFSYQAPVAGWYRVSINSCDYASNYSLSWPTTQWNQDDEIPGIGLLTGATVNGASSANDAIDVYRVTIPAGKFFTATLDCGNGHDYDMFMLRSSAPAWSAFGESEQHLLGSAAGVADPEVLTGRASTGGTYYIAIRDYSPSQLGDVYSIRVTLSDVVNSQTSLNAPTSIAYNGTAQLSGRVTMSGSDTGVYPCTVKLYRNGAVVQTLATNQYGNYVFYDRPTRRYSYQVGSAPQAGSGVQPSMSQARIVAPRAFLTPPVIPSAVRSGSTYTATGFLKPRHTAGAYPVKLYGYRLEASGWVLRRIAAARASNYSAYSKYTGRIRLPYAGRWKVVAYSPADALHADSFSAPRFTTVNKTTMSISGGGTHNYGTPFTLKGTLRNASGNGIRGAAVYLEESWDGSSWSTARRVITNSSGVASALLCPNSTRYYRWRFRGTSSNAPGGSYRSKVTLRAVVVSGRTGSTGAASRTVRLPASATIAHVESFNGTSYDMYLYDGMNNLVERLSTSGNATWYICAPRAGAYNLRVNAYPGAYFRLTLQ